MKKTYLALLLAGLLPAWAFAMLPNPIAPEDLGLRTLLATPTPQAAGQPAGAAGSKEFSLQGFLWLRLEGELYSGGGIFAPGPQAPKWTAPPAPSGAAGLFAKKAELAFSGSLNSWLKWVAGLDLASLRLADLGLEMKDLPLWADWKFDLKAGQFRPAFGWEPRRPSQDLDFQERALIYGGAHPFGNLVAPWLAERAMGLHFWHQKDLGLFNYELGLSLANSLQETQAPGTASLSQAFPSQAQDLAPSASGRLGLEPAALNAFLPLGARLFLGASLAHDSQNSVFLANSPTTQAWADLAGLDARLEMLKGLLRFQGEWASRNFFGSAPALNPVYQGLTQRSEAWYASAALQPLGFFWAQAPQLELLGRYENILPDVHARAATFPGSCAAATLGLKWVYLQNCCTSLNYTLYAPEGDFHAMEGTALISLQQQLSF